MRNNVAYCDINQKYRDKSISLRAKEQWLGNCLNKIAFNTQFRIYMDIFPIVM